MNAELTKKLWEKYPKIFQGRTKSIKESLIPFGFECGDGWYNIINQLCSTLQWDTDHNNKGSDEPYPQVEATQVKEKFGRLCFYTKTSSIAQSAIIRFVESLSAHVCEECGSMDHIGQTQGWIKTLCIDCAEVGSNWVSYTAKEEGYEKLPIEYPLEEEMELPLPEIPKALIEQ
jgi:hypothetical protein